MNVVRFHGPIQLSHFVSNGVLRLRCRVIPGLGRALLDRMELASLPGPHQRCCQPAVTIQLPSAIPK